jgi:hypothetical protein
MSSGVKSVTGWGTGVADSNAELNGQRLRNMSIGYSSTLHLTGRIR